jgi:hypothetical protein
MMNALGSRSTSDPDWTLRWGWSLRIWTGWNHKRTMASFAAVALLVADWIAKLNKEAKARASSSSEPSGGGPAADHQK